MNRNPGRRVNVERPNGANPPHGELRVDDAQDLEVNNHLRIIGFQVKNFKYMSRYWNSSKLKSVILDWMEIVQRITYLGRKKMI